VGAVRRDGLTTIVIEDVRIARPFRAAVPRIGISFGWRDLLRGHIDRIHLASPRLRIDAATGAGDAAAVLSRALERVLAPPDALPFTVGAVEVKGLAAKVATPAGTVSVGLDGRGGATGDGLQFDGRLGVSGNAAALRGDIVILKSADGAITATVGGIEGRLSGPVQLALADSELALSVRSAAGGGGGTLRYHLAARDLRAGTLSARTITLGGEIGVVVARGQASLTTSRCSDLAVDGLIVDGVARAETPLGFCLSSDAPAPEAPGGLTLRAAQRGAEARLRVGDFGDVVFPPGALSAKLRLAGVALAGEKSFALHAAQVQLPEASLVLDDVRSAGMVEGLQHGRANISVGRIAYKADPAYFAPLRLEGGVQLAPASVSFTGEVALPGTAARAALQLEAAAGWGRISVRLASLPLGENPRGLAAYSPWLARFVSAQAGTVEGTGRYAWSGTAYSADVDLALRDFVLRMAGRTVKGNSARAIVKTTDGKGRYTLAARGIDSGAVRARSVALEGGAAVGIVDGQPALRLGRCARLDVEGLALTSGVVAETPFGFCLTADAPLTADHDSRLRLAQDEAQASLRISSGGRVSFPPRSLQAWLTLPAPSGRMRFAVDAASIVLPGPRLVLADVKVAGAVPENGVVQTSFSAGNLSHEADPAYFAPLRLSGSARLGPDGLSLKGAVTDRGRLATAEFAVEAAAGKGTASIRLRPLQLAAGGPGLGYFSPWLARRAFVRHGSLTAVGRYSWPDPAHTLDLNLLLQDFDLRIGGRTGNRLSGPLRVRGRHLAVSGPMMLASERLRSDINVLLQGVSLANRTGEFGNVNGVVRLRRLRPLSTYPSQEISFQRADSVLVADNGRIRFSADASAGVTIEDGSFDWAGGAVRLSAGSLDFGADRWELPLTLSGLDLGGLLRRSGVPGLTGEGTLRGTIDLVVRGGLPEIRAAELRTLEPGVLRYRPAPGVDPLGQIGQTGEFVRKLLRDFHYERLVMTLSGNVRDGLKLNFVIHGANREVYDGHPVELYLTLDGDLERVLRTGTAGYQVPDAIKDRMEDLVR
jgi:hypothetical protein